MKRVTHNEVIRNVYEKMWKEERLPHPIVKRIINEYNQEIQRNLINGDYVRMYGFVTFYPRWHPVNVPLTENHSSKYVRVIKPIFHKIFKDRLKGRRQ